MPDENWSIDEIDTSELHIYILQDDRVVTRQTFFEFQKCGSTAPEEVAWEFQTILSAILILKS